MKNLQTCTAVFLKVGKILTKCAKGENGLDKTVEFAKAILTSANIF
jgi:hypothetical protein